MATATCIAYLSISLPSSAKQQHEITKLEGFGRTSALEDKFSFSPLNWAPFIVQSWMKLVEKTVQKLTKSTFSLLLPCEFHSSYLFSLPPPPIQYWFGKCWLPGNCSWPTPRKQHWDGGGGGIVCLQLKALERVIFFRVLSTIVGLPPLFLVKILGIVAKWLQWREFTFNGEHLTVTTTSSQNIFSSHKSTNLVISRSCQRWQTNEQKIKSARAERAKLLFLPIVFDHQICKLLTFSLLLMSLSSLLKISIDTVKII